MQSIERMTIFERSARIERLEVAKRNQLIRREINQGADKPLDVYFAEQRQLERLIGAPIRHSKSRVRAMPSEVLRL